MTLDDDERISFRVEALIDGEWISNRKRFPSHDEAQMYALEFSAHWNCVSQARIVASPDNITHRWREGFLEPVKPGDVA